MRQSADQQNSGKEAPVGLPHNPIPEITQLLAPAMTTEDDRELWLTQAFYSAEPRLYHQIDRSGDALQFVTRLIRITLDFGLLVTGQHALAAILEAVRLRYGVDHQATITRLVAACDQYRRPASESTATRAPAALSPSTLPLVGPVAGEGPPPTLAVRPQTIETPPAERRPTVFVSYARLDELVVRRLLAELEAAGHTGWLDTTAIQGGEDWVRAITEGINNSYAFITIVSAAGNASRWVQREFLFAEQKGKLIIPVLIDEEGLPISMIERQGIRLTRGWADGVRQLLTTLPAPSIALPALPGAREVRAEAGGPLPPAAVPSATLPVEQPAPALPVSRRALELAYLDRLRLEELLHTEKYTPLAGTARDGHQPTAPRGVIEAPVMRQEFEHLRRLMADRVTSPAGEPRRYSDIREAIAALGQAVLLGEPGAGKTTTLFVLAHQYVARAIADPSAPLPLLARLGRWTDPNQPLLDFLAHEVGTLGPALPALLTARRVVLLLDGLNELPVAQREPKSRHVAALLARQGAVDPDLVAVVSCREQDYTVDLGVDRIVITPLDPGRIREFVTRYLGEAEGERLFWRLAGGEALRGLWATWERLGASWEQFWTAPDIPRANPNVFGKTRGAEDQLWRDHVRSASSLLRLAANPYLLLMLIEVYHQTGDLPANRGQLFASFVTTLLARERVDEASGPLLAGLTRLALAMQVRRGQSAPATDADQTDAVTVMARSEVTPEYLDEALLVRANSASILAVGDEVRFTHQLLQEYFAATAMAAEIAAGRLSAATLWPRERWWERTNWEEATVLLAGLASADCSEVLAWVGEANPVVAARCIADSGAVTPPATAEQWRRRWLARLVDEAGEPDPRSRAAVGRALAVARLDDRPGVGLRDGLPDLLWRHVPGGPCQIGGDNQAYRGRARQTVEPPAFWIARYPITNGQYAAFVEAEDGFANPVWWAGLPRSAEALPSRFPDSNAPRESVSWYAAMAFCRWLTAHRSDLSLPTALPADVVIRLPTEEEWEKAACWDADRQRRRNYPYGDRFATARGNTSGTRIGRTSAVGIFPSGASPCGAEEMSGNVWEWTLSRWESDRAGDTEAPRVLRGGSWDYNQDLARAASRDWNDPVNWDDDVGFRVVVSAPLPAPGL